jgi:hypothetical protein
LVETVAVRQASAPSNVVHGLSIHALAHGYFVDRNALGVEALNSGPALSLSNGDRHTSMMARAADLSPRVF